MQVLELAIVVLIGMELIDCRGKILIDGNLL